MKIIKKSFQNVEQVAPIEDNTYRYIKQRLIATDPNMKEYLVNPIKAEIVYATIIRISDDIKEKKDFEKIILCDVPTIIYPDLESSFLNLIHNSGHPSIKLEKKIDFDKLYSERSN